MVGWFQVLVEPKLEIHILHSCGCCGVASTAVSKYLVVCFVLVLKCGLHDWDAFGQPCNEFGIRLFLTLFQGCTSRCS